MSTTYQITVDEMVAELQEMFLSDELGCKFVPHYENHEELIIVPANWPFQTAGWPGDWQAYARIY